MENFFGKMPERKFSELSINPEYLHLVKGTSVRLIKRRVNNKSTIEAGIVLDGVLDTNIKIGEPILLNNKTSNTSKVEDIGEKGGHYFIKTATSVYELVKVITLKDWEFELMEYHKKGNGDFAVFSGQASFENQPAQQIIVKYGFKTGDQVAFFSEEKERIGRIESYGTSNSLIIRDENGNANGFIGILLAGGYVRKLVFDEK